MLALMPLGEFATPRDFRWLLSSRAAKPGARGGNSGMLYKYEKPARTVLAAMNIHTSSIAHYPKGLQNHDLAMIKQQ